MRRGFRAWAGRLAGFALVGCCVGLAAHAEPYTNIPNRSLTPGEYDTSLTKADLCTTNWGTDERHVTQAMKMEVFRSYGFPLGQKDPRCPCAVDHDGPRSAGGKDTVKNLMIQTHKGRWNSYMKDRLELNAHKKYCQGKITLGQYRGYFQGDWRQSYSEIYGDPYAHK